MSKKGNWNVEMLMKHLKWLIKFLKVNYLDKKIMMRGEAALEVF